MSGPGFDKLFNAGSDNDLNIISNYIKDELDSTCYVAFTIIGKYIDIETNSTRYYLRLSTQSMKIWWSSIGSGFNPSNVAGIVSVSDPYFIGKIEELIKLDHARR